MTDQKPKIDLKARLGKKTAAGSSPLAGSVPMQGGGPVAPGPQPVGAGIPTQSRPPVQASRPAAAPQPGVGGSIPAPQFGGARPAPAAANPYGAAPAAAVAAHPAAIRIEVGDDIHVPGKGGGKKIAILCLVTAVIGGGLGFAVGGGVERGKGATAAVAGAQELIKEVEKANAEVLKLADTLKSAKEKLGKRQFPEAEVSALGSINIPFDGKNLNGKGIGRFKPEIVSLLINYAGSTTEANAQKEKLQNVLSGAKKGIQELLATEATPPVRWAVTLESGPNGPWAKMVTVPAPFGIKDKWPDDIKLGSGKDALTLKRYTGKGDPSGDYIAVNPLTQNAVCPADTIFKLRRELNDLETVLRGDTTPGDEKVGLIDAAKQLTDKLKRIGAES